MILKMKQISDKKKYFSLRSGVVNFGVIVSEHFLLDVDYSIKYCSLFCSDRQKAHASSWDGG